MVCKYYIHIYYNILLTWLETHQPPPAHPLPIYIPIYTTILILPNATVWRRRRWNRRHRRRRRLFTDRYIIIIIILVNGDGETSISIISVSGETENYTSHGMKYSYMYNTILSVQNEIINTSTVPRLHYNCQTHTNLYIIIYIYTHDAIVNRYDLTLSVSADIERI